MLFYFFYFAIDCPGTGAMVSASATPRVLLVCCHPPRCFCVSGCLFLTSKSLAMTIVASLVGDVGHVNGCPCTYVSCSVVKNENLYIESRL